LLGGQVVDLQAQVLTDDSVVADDALHRNAITRFRRTTTSSEQDGGPHRGGQTEPHGRDSVNFIWESQHRDHANMSGRSIRSLVVTCVGDSRERASEDVRSRSLVTCRFHECDDVHSQSFVLMWRVSRRDFTLL
jgi:hypothetical protein